MTVLQPPSWPRPKGYANGIAASGRLVFVAGQIGWDSEGRIVPGGLAAQVRQALHNTVLILAEANARPEHVARMTWYILDKAEYQRQQREIGAAYRAVMGKHFPAMAMLVVAGLMEEGAEVEIETTAVAPEH